jgi:DNA-binding NtrC family response regulator
MPTILVIDDNRAVSTALEVLFSLHDIDTLHAESPAAGLALLREQPVDLVIQDMNFSEDTTSGLEGEQLFADLRNEWPDMPVILLTAWTHLEAAVNLVKAGAADYVAKPWDDRKLLATVNTLLELTETRRELDRRRSRERRSRHQLGSAQAERRHQQQTVGAERFDPEAACAVPDKVAQGNVAVELSLFDVRRQQSQTHEAPDALVEEGGVDGHGGVDG